MTRETAISLPELDQLEAVVRSGLQSFMAVGLALIEIRETKGYRLRGHKFFKDYCEEVFGFSAKHGRRMMTAAKTARAVATATGDELRNEASARALAPVRNDPAALWKVKERLTARGQSMGTAPGQLIESILQNTRLSSHRPQLHPTPERAGRCPACGEIPATYRHIPDEKAFECSTCRARVLLVVGVKVKPEQCPRCSMKFNDENQQVDGKGYCTYCAEELNSKATRKQTAPKS